MATSKPIHECVAEHVEAAGMSKAELTRRLEESTPRKWPYLSVMRLLNGDTELSAQDMVDIAAVLGCDVADLYRPPSKKRKAS